MKMMMIMLAEVGCKINKRKSMPRTFFDCHFEVQYYEQQKLCHHEHEQNGKKDERRL
jgi:hypothetical protein